jgi:hypothetical protein
VVALPPGGGRRTSTLGTGTGRATSVVVGRAGRGKTITNPSAFGTAFGLAFVEGVGEFELTGNSILLEIGDQLLMETGDFLLLEDGASAGLAAGDTTIRGIGERLVDAVGTVSGATATASGAFEEPNLTDNLLLENGDGILLENNDLLLLESNGDNVLLENGDDLLLEDGSLLLLESGAVAPPTAIKDVDGFEIFDTNGDYILEV